jgi:hypothetical protein
MPKLLLKRGRVENILVVWSRHATPRPLCHMRLQGVSGRAVLNHVDPAAPGLFIPGHPTLGDASAIPALYVRPDGGPLHVYMGSPDQWPAQLTADEFAGLDIIDIWFRGQLRRFASGARSDGVPFFGVQWQDSEGDAFRDALLPAARVWETGESWAAVSDLYKWPDGSPRIDPDEGIHCVEVHPPPPPEEPSP